MSRSAPLVVVGLDAGDPDLLRRFLREGDLAHLRRIVEEGCWGLTGGPGLVSEHASWPAVLCGASPADSGFYHFRQLRPGSYDLVSIDGRDATPAPFWADLGAHGLRSLVVDPPETSPVPGLPGLQLTDWSTHAAWDPDRFELASEPPELAAEVERRHGGRRRVIERLDSTAEDDRRLLEEALDNVAAKGALLRDLAGQGSWDLVLAVFSETHSGGHQFWRYGPGVPDPVRAPGLEQPIRDVYRAVDAELGRLRAQLPADHDVVVVSSVGLTDDFPAGGLADALLESRGYRVPAAGGGLRPLDLVRRLVPERWRVAMSRRLDRERREALLADRFRSGTDWERTTAFALPSAYTGHVRVNLEGREPRGTVAPGAEYRTLLDRLEADFRALRDPERDVPAVREVLRTIDLFPGGPPRHLPDLWVEWRGGRFMRRVVHPEGEVVQERPEWFRRSAHSRRGFLAAAGPSVRRSGRLPEVDALDLAPTFRALLGLGTPERMSGAPLSGFEARRAGVG